MKRLHNQLHRKSRSFFTHFYLYNTQKENKLPLLEKNPVPKQVLWQMMNNKRLSINVSLQELYSTWQHILYFIYLVFFKWCVILMGMQIFFSLFILYKLLCWFWSVLWCITSTLGWWVACKCHSASKVCLYSVSEVNYGIHQSFRSVLEINASDFLLKTEGHTHLPKGGFTTLTYCIKTQLLMTIEWIMFWSLAVYTTLRLTFSRAGCHWACPRPCCRGSSASLCQTDHTPSNSPTLQTPATPPRQI